MELTEKQKEVFENLRKIFIDAFKIELTDDNYLIITYKDESFTTSTDIAGITTLVEKHNQPIEGIATALVGLFSKMQIESRAKKLVGIKINLNDPLMMSTQEAAKKWNIDDSNIRQRIKSFPQGSIRKFGKQWVVTEYGMRCVFGEPR
jgi:sulfur relay (sulfurtransferase) DsrC/TusE family protein